MSLYPAAQKNPKLAATVVKLLDAAIGTEAVAEGLGNWLKNKFDPNNIPGFTDVYSKIKPYVVSDIINKLPKDKF
jgi:hypothetical protein